MGAIKRKMGAGIGDPLEENKGSVLGWIPFGVPENIHLEASLRGKGRD